MRHTNEQLDIWRRDGGVILDSFFTADELAPCVDGMEQMYGHLRPDDPAAHKNFDAKTATPPSSRTPPTCRSMPLPNST